MNDAGLFDHVSGAGGEHIAEQYLRSRGAQLLCKHFRAVGGEIDLIVRMDGRIVFVEVKARFGARYGTPGEAITRAQAQRIRRAALVYLKAHGGTAQPVRFDALLISEQGIKHIPGAF